MEIIKPRITLSRREPQRYYVPLPVEISYRAISSPDAPDFLQVVAVYEAERLLDRDSVQYRFVGVNVMHLPTQRAADVSTRR